MSLLVKAINIYNPVIDSEFPKGIPVLLLDIKESLNYEEEARFFFFFFNSSNDIKHKPRD